VLLPRCRFALAEVHTGELASKAELLHHMRPQLSNLMEQVLADKADAMLAGCQRLMALLPQYRPVPMLEGIGAQQLHDLQILCHCCCCVPAIVVCFFSTASCKFYSLVHA
jgi:hypothetical protein